MLNIATPMQNFDKVHAAGASWKGIFEKPDELADGTYKTAGDADDVVGYINFGQRPTSVNYSGYYSTDTAAAGPIKWLIIGQDTEGTLELYSEEPLMSANEYDPGSNSIFDPWIAPYKKTVAPFGEVYINHYGASNFRKNLQSIAGNTSYFNSAEKELMLSTAVKTKNALSNTEYTTADKLYGLHATVFDGDCYVGIIYAGENNSLPIDTKYCKGLHWLRSPDLDSDGHALVSGPNMYVSWYAVGRNSPTVSAAFKLGLADILFAGNAAIPDTASSDTEFNTLDFSSSMNTFNLRIKGGQMSGKVETGGAGLINYTASSDERLVVLAQSTAGGDTYSYVKDGTGNPETFNLRSLSGLNENEAYSVKAWTEKTSSAGNAPMYYASEPLELTIPATIDPTINSTSTSVDYKPGLTLKDVPYPPTDGNTKGAWSWLAPESTIDGAGEYNFDAAYTPTDTATYKPVTKSIAVTVNEAKVDDSADPSTAPEDQIPESTDQTNSEKPNLESTGSKTDSSEDYQLWLKTGDSPSLKMLETAALAIFSGISIMIHKKKQRDNR